MAPYYIRKATTDDIKDIVAIYNSNAKFLIHHLGVSAIDDFFIQREMSEMEALHFLSCVIIDTQTKTIIGILDYKPDSTVYLSLVMLDARLHGRGIGTVVYRLFEDTMIKEGKQTIRIDVVNDYKDNVVEFWRRQGFAEQSTIRLQWGEKLSNAFVMLKSLSNHLLAP